MIYIQIGQISNCTCGNPCNCAPEPTSTCSTVCGPDCFVLSNPLVQPINSVGPCGQVGTIAISDTNSYGNCAAEDLVFDIQGYDEVGFEDVQIVDGDIQFTTADTAVPLTYYKGVYRVRCKSTGQGAYGEFMIGIKDLCQYVTCGSAQVCNKCTGVCEDAPVDLEVTEGEGSVTPFIDLAVTDPTISLT